jgi:carbon-monoxide dehydrogenase large subunit
VATTHERDQIHYAEMAVDKECKILAVRDKFFHDAGAYAPYGLTVPLNSQCTLLGCYDIQHYYSEFTSVFTNKTIVTPYRGAGRQHGVFVMERLLDMAAKELSLDKAEIRRRNFIQPEQFPYESPTGFVYDSGDYEAALREAMRIVGYDEIQKEKEEARKEGKLVGIGIASFTEVVGAGHGDDYDILGLKMFDSAELRVHPTGKAILKLGVKSQGQGHETTFAQIVAEELGIPASDIKVVEGDTDNTPYGLGTYASRSTPVAGAATAIIARQLREKAKTIAAHLLEASEDDLEWDVDKFKVKGDPESSVSIQDIAFAAYTNPGGEAGLEGVHYYDPPNMTFPFGSYIVVVDVDPGTGQWKVRRMVAVDDCGVRINPMVVDGQIHGGLTEGFAMSSMQYITFDESGNCIGSNFMDYLIPTAWETPRFELGETVTPSPHHPIGAKGIGESATVGSPAAYVNAVIDALQPYGVTNIDMPVSADRVWEAMESGSG